MKLIDFVSPSRWKSVIIWILKIILKKLDKGGYDYLEVHEIEQYMYRLLSCPDCVAAGKCTHCGCDTIGRMNNRSDYCSNDKWGLFMDKEQWENFKKVQGIIFLITKK